MSTIGIGFDMSLLSPLYPIKCPAPKFPTTGTSFSVAPVITIDDPLFIAIATSIKVVVSGVKTTVALAE